MKHIQEGLDESAARIPQYELDTLRYENVKHKDLNPKFEKNGLELIEFTIGEITVPEAIQQAIDERSSMGVVGNMAQYQQYKSAKAIEKAAENPNGGAGEGIGMGMGFGMASQMMNQQQAQQTQQPQQQNTQPPQQSGPPPVPTAVVFHAVINGKQAGPFCLDELKQMLAKNEFSKETLVWKQGMDNWIKAGEVGELKDIFGSVPPPLPPQ